MTDEETRRQRLMEAAEACDVESRYGRRRRAPEWAQHAAAIREALALLAQPGTPDYEKRIADAFALGVIAKALGITDEGLTVQQIAARVTGTPAEPDWQPIASAPQGELVLLGYADWPTPQVGSKDDDGRWWDDNGEYTLGFPTHWMPLPPPPHADAQPKARTPEPRQE